LKCLLTRHVMRRERRCQHGGCDATKGGAKCREIQRKAARQQDVMLPHAKTRCLQQRCLPAYTRVCRYDETMPAIRRNDEEMPRLMRCSRHASVVLLPLPRPPTPPCPFVCARFEAAAAAHVVARQRDIVSPGPPQRQRRRHAAIAAAAARQPSRRRAAARHLYAPVFTSYVV